MEIKEIEKRAEYLARAAHYGLEDMQGNPAIWHVERVANRTKKRYENPYLTSIAWLHDLIEDTDIDAWDLESLGFPGRVIIGVSVLTHKSNQNYMEYIQDIQQYPDARCVKIEDLQENLERGKVGLDKDTTDRLFLKHSKALEFLQN